MAQSEGTGAPYIIEFKPGELLVHHAAETAQDFRIEHVAAWK